MANKEASFIASNNLVIVDKQYTTQCLGSWIDCWDCARRLKNEGSRVNVKCKSTEDKVRHEKTFEVDETIDSENSRASPSQVRGKMETRFKINKNRSLGLFSVMVFSSLHRRALE